MKLLAIAIRIELLDHAYKYFCNSDYIEKTLAYGFTPLLIPTLDHIEEIANQCDALLLPGGYDIASAYFKQPQHPSATLYDYPIDHYDLCIVEAFLKANKPMLGICRGMQILNVYFKGTLHQDMDTLKHIEERNTHLVIPQANTVFETLLAPFTPVNSFHHQCVDNLGENLILGARAKDGTIEAFSHTYLPILGVQWHPEKLKKDTILPYFFDVLCES